MESTYREGVPEGDVAEQRRALVPEEAVDTPTLGHEVPEADAFEQTQSVPLDDEERWG